MGLIEALANIPVLGRIHRKRIDDILDQPIESSFQIQQPDEERKAVYDDEGNSYFVYRILFEDGSRYNKIDGELYTTLACPTLPTSITSSFKSKIAKLREKYRPEEAVELENARLEQSSDVSARLIEAARRYGLVVRKVGSNPIFGTSIDKLSNLLFVPAETAEEADQKIRDYEREVTGILEPLKCSVEYILEALPGDTYTPQSFFFKGLGRTGRTSHPFDKAG